MDTQLHILDAKREYMSRLSTDIAPFIESKFKRLYEEAVAEKKNKALFVFQQKLKEIPAWNEHDIQTLTTTIENHLAIKRNAKNQYLSSLIAMSFVSYLKIMSSCRLNQQKNPPQMRLKLPSNAKFIHRSFVEAARLYYENPYIVRQGQQKQMDVITKAVETAVRELIPLEDILDVYLQDCVDDSKTVPPILSPVQSVDEDPVVEAEANDDAFPMAFRSDDMTRDDDEEQTFAPQPPSSPISPPPTEQPPIEQPTYQEPTPPPPPPPQPQQQPSYDDDIPTAYQYRQEHSSAPPPPPPAPEPVPQTTMPAPQATTQSMQQQQQAQSNLYNDASDDEDFH